MVLKITNNENKYTQTILHYYIKFRIEKVRASMVCCSVSRHGRMAGRG